MKNMKMKPSRKAIRVIERIDAIARASESPLYHRRLQRNIKRRHRLDQVDHAWRALCRAILSSRQRSSGMKTLFHELEGNGALVWDHVRQRPSRAASGARRFNDGRKKADYLKQAVPWFKENWDHLSEIQRDLDDMSVDDWEARLEAERIAARFVGDCPGVGPKQSRNFWQMLGYAVWTIPLDSRIRNILQADPFNYPLGASNLGSWKRYAEVEDLVVALASEAGTYPCLVDATLFDLEGLMRAQVGLPHPSYGEETD